MNDRESVAAAGGTNPVPISATEHCLGEECGAPLFTHKAHFQLIDNILATDPAAAASLGLRFALEARGRPRAIVEGTSFSDHLPIWGSFSVRPG
jgi:hypothetical protein